VTGNIVSGNSAHSAHNYYGWGGGIYAEGSTVIDNIVTGNSAPGYYGGGGGIHAEGGTVTGNVVTGNSAPGYYADGGGIYIRLGTAAGNFVSGNTASNCGGIYAYRNSLVKENTVTGNSAPTGGGICAGWFSQAIGNTVSGNSAVEGGGIFAWDSSSVMSNTVSANGVFTNTGQGSGVYFLRGTADFLYNTVVGNTAISPTVVIGGVAIYGTPQFHHNNLYGNSNYDVVVLSSRDISGTHNYWGSVATVDILAHVYDGDDDSARGRLLYIPYLQDPDPNAPVPPPLNLRATFAGDSASLSWDAIPSTTTGYGYKVYYDTDASGPPYHGTGAAQGDSPVDVGNATHFTLSGLGGGGIYIAVTAYNTQGRESWYSNEVINPWRVYLPAVLR
jgi:parallel beta-helix repeat protein